MKLSSIHFERPSAGHFTRYTLPRPPSLAAITSSLRFLLTAPLRFLVSHGAGSTKPEYRYRSPRLALDKIPV